MSDGWRLYADMGNSTLHWAVHEPGGWSNSVRTVPDEQETPRDTALELRATLETAGYALDECSGAALLSSNPSMTEHVEAALADLTGREVALLGRDMWSELTVIYNDSSLVGQDRLAMVEGAWGPFDPPMVVLGVGTCVTAQALTSEGEFMAGGIAPGLPALAAGIGLTAAHLADDVDEAVRMLRERVELPAEVQSTAENLAVGLLMPLVGAVERLSATMRKLVGSNAPVIATGGDAYLVAAATDAIDKVDEMLALDGLRQIDELRRAEG